MPQSVCPRCQTPVEPKSPYLRVYYRDESDREAYTRIHLTCPAPAVDDSPNLASMPHNGAQVMTGGGAEPVAASGPSLPSRVAQRAAAKAALFVVGRAFRYVAKQQAQAVAVAGPQLVPPPPPPPPPGA